LYLSAGVVFLAEIAVEIESIWSRRTIGSSTAGSSACRTLAQGDGWGVEELICTYGRQDRPFEEQHAQVSISVVLAGTFQYRAANSSLAGELMIPGSLLLGNAGESFECGHEHGRGDRCLSFHFAPEYFDRIAADVGASCGQRVFRRSRLPALRALSPLVAGTCAGLAASSGHSGGPFPELLWEEFGIQLAACSVRLANDASRQVKNALPSAIARVTRTARMIEESHESQPALSGLARKAGLSPYHFLRTFTQLTGITPHQYVRRARLRQAAIRLLTELAKILDIALDCRFGDMSNFDRAFHDEFGVSPQRFRRRRPQGILDLAPETWDSLISSHR